MHEGADKTTASGRKRGKRRVLWGAAVVAATLLAAVHTRDFEVDVEKAGVRQQRAVLVLFERATEAARPCVHARSYGLGHGIGLDAEEPPYLRADSTDRLLAGSALALHVVLHGPDGRGALGEQTVVVTPCDAEPLTADRPSLVERA